MLKTIKIFIRWKQKCIDDILKDKTVNIFNDQDEKILDNSTEKQVEYIYKTIKESKVLSDCLIDPFCILSNIEKRSCSTCGWGKNHGGSCIRENTNSDWTILRTRLGWELDDILDYIGIKQVSNKINELFGSIGKKRVYRKLVIGEIKPSGKKLARVYRKLIITKGVNGDVTY